MLTIQIIREELREVKYYYEKKESFDNMKKLGVQSRLDKLVAKYNKAVENAPAKLYNLYYAIYINGMTQLEVSFEWNYVVDYIRQLNRRLYDYFLKELNKGVAV